jgi:hypothetical protein
MPIGRKDERANHYKKGLPFFTEQPKPKKFLTHKNNNELFNPSS